MGVWIEITSKRGAPYDVLMSLPAWECGLKSIILGYVVWLLKVTPCVGVWIEIGY